MASLDALSLIERLSPQDQFRLAVEVLENAQKKQVHSIVP
jgi:hypothetical protein